MKPTTGLIVMGNWDALMDEKVFQNTDVETVGFKLYWNRIQPSEDIFNFETLDKNLMNCAKYGKRYVFEIATGSFSPSFIYPNVKKLTFVEFRNASNPEPPLKDFNVPLFTSARYKEYLKSFLIILKNHIKSLVYDVKGDVFDLMWKVSVSGINETTSEYRINSQNSVTVGHETTTNATEIWTKNGVSAEDVLDNFKDFYDIVNLAFPNKNKGVYMLGKGFPPLSDPIDIEKRTADWVKDSGIDDTSFCYTSIKTTNNGGSLFEYIKGIGLPVGGELNQKMYEYCTSAELDAVLASSSAYGFNYMQIRDDNVLNSPEVIKKYKNSFN